MPVVSKASNGTVCVIIVREILCGRWHWAIGFFSYHSQKQKAIVGLVEVIVVSHSDRTTDDPRWDCVDIKSLPPMEPPVTLAMIKKHPRLAKMMLVINPRLSVQPDSMEHWQIIFDMSQDD